jgi:hypothetical protein
MYIHLFCFCFPQTPYKGQTFNYKFNCYYKHLAQLYKLIIRTSACQSQWLHGLRRVCQTARTLRSWVWISHEAWVYVRVFLCFIALWKCRTPHVRIPTKMSKRMYIFRSQEIAQWYNASLRAGWSGVWVPAGTGNFSLHHRVQIGSGAHPASYPMGTRGSFLGGKTAGVWSWLLTSI